MDNRIIRNILEENRKFWDEIFKDSDFDYKNYRSDKILEVIKRLREYNVQRVLDLGCGFGIWSIALLKAGFKVTACDISKEAIKIVREWAQREGLSIDTLISPAQELELEGGFDAVICNSVLDHMPYKEAVKALQNIERILNPGGLAYITFDGDREEEEDFVLLEDGTRVYTSGKRRGMLWRFYSNGEIKTLLESCRNMEIMEFVKRNDRRREVWVRRK